MRYRQRKYGISAHRIEKTDECIPLYTSPHKFFKTPSNETNQKRGRTADEKLLS